MSLRVVLIASGVIGLLFGLMFLLVPDMAIQNFQLGTADVASRLFGRSEGAALVSVALMNFIASRDRGGSWALRGVLAANLLLHIFGIGVDFTEAFPKTGGWWVGTIIHLIFIAAFAWYLAKWREGEPA
jgi:hypothetical protein